MEKRAAGFIIFRKISAQFEYLLLQASYGSHHWTPPKGHVDPGESDIETAFRETKEEAGFEKDDLKIMEGFQKVLKYPVNGKPKTVVYWLAELYKNTPVVLSSEHQDFKWAELNDACKLSGFKDFENLLQECEQYLSKKYKKKMSSRIGSVRDAIENALYDPKNPWTKYFQMCEEKTGVKRIQLFMGLVVFIAVYLVFGYGPQLLCNIIGFAYPAYCSMKAVESPQKDDDTKWLTYWVVFATFSIAEYFSNVICSWIPVYWLLKCIFLLWCFLPTPFCGSVIIYNKYIRPYFLQHHSTVDNLLNELKTKGMAKATKLAAGVKSE